MEVEMLLRIAAVLIAGGMLLSNFNFSIQSIYKYIISLIKREKKVKPINSNMVSFLDIIASWHVLKNQCETYGLIDAVKKIDEVFPLLNVEHSNE